MCLVQKTKYSTFTPLMVSKAMGLRDNISGRRLGFFNMDVFVGKVGSCSSYRLFWERGLTRVF